MEQDAKKENNGMLKLATFIVDKRNLFFLITIILLLFSVFSSKWVNVENDLTNSLHTAQPRSWWLIFLIMRRIA